MLNMRYSILIVAMLFWSYAWSNDPTNYKTITHEDQKTEQNKAASKDEPAFTEKDKPEIIKYAGKITNADANDSLNTERQLVEYTRKLSFFTALLAIFTAILAGIAIWQGIQLKRTVDSQERTERAILFMGKMEPHIFSTAPEDVLFPGAKDAPCPRIDYCFTNLGRTAAIIDRIEVKLILSENLPPNRGYEGSQAMYGEAVLPTDKTTKMFPAIFDRPITKEEILEVRNETKKFYLFGFARYDDIFDYVHTYSFCFQFLPKTNVFFVTGGEQYNFRATQKKKYEIS